MSDHPRHPLPLLGASMLAIALVVGCSFTGEPDPGGVADVGDAGLADPPPQMNLDAGANVDAVAFPDDMQAPAPEPDAQADQDAENEPEPNDGAVDAEAADAQLPDGDLPDGDLPDTGLDSGLDGGPDAATPTPEALCDTACTALVACGPGPEPEECRRECLAEDDEIPGNAERLADCVNAHIADGRCDIAALQICMSDDPLPLDPACVIACDGLGTCDALPARPDCAETCTEEPGPDRQRLLRCVEAHIAGDRCDGIGFIGCADAAPAPEDTCRFTCSALLACQEDFPFDGCVDGCLADDERRRAVAICAGVHLDRGRCATEAFRDCAEQ